MKWLNVGNPQQFDEVDKILATPIPPELTDEQKASMSSDEITMYNDDRAVDIELMQLIPMCGFKEDDGTLLTKFSIPCEPCKDYYGRPRWRTVKPATDLSIYHTNDFVPFPYLSEYNVSGPFWTEDDLTDEPLYTMPETFREALSA